MAPPQESMGFEISFGAIQPFPRRMRRVKLKDRSAAASIIILYCIML